jgi:hypothetical protein
MTLNNPATNNPATVSRGTSTAAARSSLPASRRWLCGALILAGAAQLITISALTSVDPIAATWSALLLAVAPAPLAMVAVFARTPTNRLAAVAAIAAIIVGGAGQILHTGLFFLPALVVLAVGAARLWRQRS